MWRFYHLNTILSQLLTQSRVFFVELFQAKFWPAFWNFSVILHLSCSIVFGHSFKLQWAVNAKPSSQSNIIMLATFIPPVLGSSPVANWFLQIVHHYEQDQNIPVLFVNLYLLCSFTICSLFTVKNLQSPTGVRHWPLWVHAIFSSLLGPQLNLHQSTDSKPLDIKVATMDEFRSGFAPILVRVNSKNTKTYILDNVRAFLTVSLTGSHLGVIYLEFWFLNEID